MEAVEIADRIEQARSRRSRDRRIVEISTVDGPTVRYEPVGVVWRLMVYAGYPIWASDGRVIYVETSRDHPDEISMCIGDVIGAERRTRGRIDLPAEDIVSIEEVSS